MTERKFIDAAVPVGMRLTADGYLVGEVRCARTGIQQYLASEIGLDGSGVVNVYRPEDTVFDRDSMATFAGKPVTVLHPSEAVTAENWRRYAVGDIGPDIARDGEFVRVPIKLMDAAAIKAVQDGTREISMGYTCGLKVEDGVAPDGTAYQAVQTGPLRINHLAIVPQARGGPELRIGDAGKWGASPVTAQSPHRLALDQGDGPMTDKPMQKVVVDGLTIETTDQGAQALAKVQKQLADAQADAEKRDADHAKALAAKDADLAKKDAEIDSLKGKVLDGAALDAAVAKRADLIGKAKAIAPEVKTDGLSDADIRKAVVLAKLGDAVKDKPEAYIDARFDILAEDAEAQGHVHRALANPAAVLSDKAAYEKALADNIASLNAKRTA